MREEAVTAEPGFFPWNRNISYTLSIPNLEIQNVPTPETL